MVLLLIVVAAGVTFAWHRTSSHVVAEKRPDAKQPVKSPATANQSTATPAPNPCAGNNLDKFISISISARHMWVCEQAKQVYDSPVITGMEKLAADLTPTGTYHIYAKQTDLTLKGADSTGSWSDPVSYWMPFLNNQYGTYGFHDATWRNPNEFGNIDPNSNKGSHGCVELPLATSKWLYNWAEVGTTLTITS